MKHVSIMEDFYFMNPIMGLRCETLIICLMPIMTSVAPKSQKLQFSNFSRQSVGKEYVSVADRYLNDSFDTSNI